MRKWICRAAAAVVALLGGIASSRAAILWDNGPFITSATGGSGGKPLSKVDTGGSYSLSMNSAFDGAVADDFVVPVGGEDLDSLTIYAGQTSASTASLTNLTVNFYLSNPASNGVLIKSLSFPLSSSDGTFAAYRAAGTGTDTTRKIFSYTVNLDKLPAAGVLAAGTYWMSISASGSQTGDPWVPMVTPAPGAANAVIEVNPGTGDQWSAATDNGHATTFPFLLSGTAVPEPASAGVVAASFIFLSRRGKRNRVRSLQ